MLRTWYGSTARSFQWFGFGWQGRMTLHWNLEPCSSRILDACNENMCSKRIESYNQWKVVRTRCQSLEPAKTSSRFSPGGVTPSSTPQGGSAGSAKISCRDVPWHGSRLSVSWALRSAWCAWCWARDSFPWCRGRFPRAQASSTIPPRQDLGSLGVSAGWDVMGPELSV